MSSQTLDILHDAPGFMVINKPPGLRSVPGKGSDVDPTIRDSVEWRTRHMLGVDERTPVVVHRLDLDTSGLMVVAKDRATHRALSRQFMDRKVGKSYTALLGGHLGDSLGTEGAVDLPLIIDWKYRPKQCVHFALGKQARTLWRVITRESLNGNPVTRVDLRPITGRSHQLRVHAATACDFPRPGEISVTKLRDTRSKSDDGTHRSLQPTLQGGLGAAIVGDTLYAPLATQEILDRLALHATTLAFWNPAGGGNWLKFEAPAEF